MSKEVLERALEKLTNKLESPKRDFTPKDSLSDVMFYEGTRRGHEEALQLFKHLIITGDL